MTSRKCHAVACRNPGGSTALEVVIASAFSAVARSHSTAHGNFCRNELVRRDAEFDIRPLFSPELLRQAAKVIEILQHYRSAPVTSPLAPSAPLLI